MPKKELKIVHRQAHKFHSVDILITNYKNLVTNKNANIEKLSDIVLDVIKTGMEFLTTNPKTGATILHHLVQHKADLIKHFDTDEKM